MILSDFRYMTCMSDCRYTWFWAFCVAWYAGFRLNLRGGARQATHYDLLACHKKTNEARSLHKHE